MVGQPYGRPLKELEVQWSRVLREYDYSQEGDLGIGLGQMELRPKGIRIELGRRVVRRVRFSQVR